MLRDPFRLTARAAVFFLACILIAVPAPAQETKAAAAGRFDFYVLALSWSPSFCEKQNPGRRANNPQCNGRPYSFVVHGLWPQFEHGYPSYCQVPAPRLDGALADKMLDLMPGRGLIYHEWNRHGTCTGLSPQAYFATVRKAHGRVTVPPAYRELGRPIVVTPAAVAEAFIKANPGLTRDDMAIACDRKRLTEVRLCLSREFKFRACPQIVSRSCRRDSVSMPAIRGRRGS